MSHHNDYNLPLKRSVHHIRKRRQLYLANNITSRYWIEYLYVPVYWNRCWMGLDRWFEILLRILRFWRLGIDIWLVRRYLWFNFMEWYAGTKWSCELYTTNPWMVRCDFSFSLNCCWSMEHVVLYAICKCFYLWFQFNMRRYQLWNHSLVMDLGKYLINLWVTLNWVRSGFFIFVSVIMIFSATSAFRMMNYGCGCKFCFFPCMCCCQIPIGGNSVQPEAVVYPSNQPPPYYSNYPPQYQSYPTRYSSSTDTSSGSDDSYYIRTGTGQLVKVSWLKII